MSFLSRPLCLRSAQCSLQKEKMVVFWQFEDNLKLRHIQQAHPLCLEVSKISWAILGIIFKQLLMLLKWFFNGNTSPFCLKRFSWTEQICMFFLSWTWRISIFLPFFALCILYIWWTLYSITLLNTYNKFFPVNLRFTCVSHLEQRCISARWNTEFS